MFETIANISLKGKQSENIIEKNPQSGKRVVEEIPNIDLRQERADDLILEPLKPSKPGSATPAFRVTGIRVQGEAEYRAPRVVLTTGTFLQAIMHTGESKTHGGRAGEGTSSGISQSLKKANITLERFKTGTPCRLSANSIDFSTSPQLQFTEIFRPMTMSGTGGTTSTDARQQELLQLQKEYR